MCLFFLASCCQMKEWSDVKVAGGKSGKLWLKESCIILLKIRVVSDVKVAG